MSEPREFRALQALQATLLAMRPASGYFYGVDALAVKLDPDQAVEDLIAEHGPRPFVVLEVRPEAWDYNYGADQVRIELPVWVHWVHEPTRASDQQLQEPVPRTDDWRMQTYWRGCADVERALGQDPQLGGQVTSCRIDRRRQHEDARIWAVIETTIRLHRTFGRPTE